MNEYIAAIESSNILSKTDINGIITFVNEEFCALSGYSAKELIGANHNIIRHPDTPREYFAAMWATILDGKVHKGVVKNLRKNGTPFWAQTTIIPVKRSDEIVEFVAFRHDLTPQFIAQEKLLEQERIIAAQSRHAAVGQMINNIAHQWRQPLHELGLELYLLKSGSASSYARSRALIDKMSKMIEDLSDFSRPAKAATSVRLKDIFKLALSLVRMSVKRSGLKLRFKGRFDMALNTHAAEIAQVIVNIIKNAIDATTSCDKKELLITAEPCADGCELGFYDSGGGFLNEAAVFDLYYTSKHPGAGVGLGLYICKQILNAANSEIITAASPLGGAGFKVFLRSVDA